MGRMAFRAPMRIWRVILADLLRLGGLATVSLVVVIAFSFSVRFLAEGRIDVAGALRLTTLALVPMLQYALPFACGFGATLAYHRLAADNEATAAAAGGISHRALLVPAGAVGLVLAVVVALLAHQVIPRFLRSMEEIVARDLPGLISRSIMRGESVRLGNVELHARDILRAGPDAAVGAFERLRLYDVLAATLDKKGRVQGYISADEVSVWLFHEERGGERFTSAQFHFRNPSGEGMGDAVRSESFGSYRVVIPTAFRDDPKYLTFGELSALRSKPENLNTVDVLRRRLAMRLASAAALEASAGRLAEAGEIVFDRPGGERVVIRAAALVPEVAGGWSVQAGVRKRVRIDRRPRVGGTVSLVADRAWIEAEEDGAGAAPRARPTFALRLEEARSADDEESAGQSLRLGGLTSAEDSVAQFLEMPVSDLLRSAAAESGRRGVEGGAAAREAAGALRRKADDVQREVTSKQHERAAYAAACLLTLAAGAASALRRPTALPLPVYLWSFFPALGSVITISAGQGLTHAVGWPGLILLWGGVAGLGAVFGVEYAKLARH